jgi:hypothetical protein
LGQQMAALKCSSVIEHATHKPKIKGSNLVTGKEQLTTG